MLHDRPFVRFAPGTAMSQVMREVSQSGWQDVFPVLDEGDKLVGMITPDLLRLLAAERELEPWLLAVDAMQPPVTVHRDHDLREASERMYTHGLRELLVVDDESRICGFIDEADIGQVYLDKLPTA
jgi:CBS domain-containing protein